MTDEIDRLEALLREAIPVGRVWAEPDHPDLDSYEVLHETDPDTVDLLAVAPTERKSLAIAALGTLWPELLAVARATEHPTVRLIDDLCHGLGCGGCLVCLHARLRARIREVLGEADRG